MSNQSSKVFGDHRDDVLDKIQTAGSISMSPELFEQLYLSPQNRVKGDLRQRLGNPTPLGKTQWPHRTISSNFRISIGRVSSLHDSCFHVIARMGRCRWFWCWCQRVRYQLTPFLSLELLTHSPLEAPTSGVAVFSFSSVASANGFSETRFPLSCLAFLVASGSRSAQPSFLVTALTAFTRRMVLCPRA